MSKEVEILKDGVWIPKNVDELSKSDLNCPMRCPGTNDLGPCHADMGIAIKNGKPSYAYQLHQSGKTHVPGCNNYKPAKNSRTSHLDKRCADIAFKDLQARISKRCVEREVNPVDVPNEELNNKKTEGGNTGERIVRRIERVRALPSTPQSLAEVLEDLSTESSFCEGRVRDYVVDHRTIDYYQNFGIPSNRPIMVFAKKITRENQKIVDRTHELIFADCRYNAMQQPDIGDCLQYRIRDYKTREYLKDIFEQKKLNGCYLVFLCAWRKDLINPNTYIAVGETPGCIGYIKIDKCQIPFVDR